MLEASKFPTCWRIPQHPIAKENKNDRKKSCKKRLTVRGIEEKRISITAVHTHHMKLKDREEKRVVEIEKQMGFVRLGRSIGEG
jgi:hypothetical protein